MKNRRKKNRSLLPLTTGLCLLPLALSLALYPALPEQVPVHFDFSGEANGYMPKAQAAFFLPVLMTLCNLVCHAALDHDPKQAGQSKKLRAAAKWLCPALCLVLHPATLLASLGVPVPFPMLCTALLGAAFVLVGNYLPKCRQNYTMGVRTPWTLHSPENWNRTHRLAGRLWVAGGLLVALAGFWGGAMGPLLAVVLPAVALAPVAYSYILYRRGV